MVGSVTKSSLEIFLYLLWREYTWTEEGLYEFIDGFWDYIDACCAGKDDDVNGLVNQFTEETGLDMGLFNGIPQKVNGAFVRKHALMVAQLFLWSVGDWDREELEVFGAMYWSKLESYDKGDRALILDIYSMQKETGIKVKLNKPG